MVHAVRNGASIYEVARRFGVAPSTVRFWLRRAENQRLDRVNWSDRPPGRREPVNKTSRDLEDLVVTLRRELKEPPSYIDTGLANRYLILADLMNSALDGLRFGKMAARMVQANSVVGVTGDSILDLIEKLTGVSDQLEIQSSVPWLILGLMARCEIAAPGSDLQAGSTVRAPGSNVQNSV